MLEALKSFEIDGTGRFIGSEHPLHGCFDELPQEAAVLSQATLSPRHLASEQDRPEPLYCLPSIEGKFGHYDLIFSGLTTRNYLVLSVC